MYTYLELETIIQSVLDSYMDSTCRDVAEKAVLGAPEWELRVLAGRPKGAAELANGLAIELKKREAAQDD